jgi:membrane protein DedA with SNARE-associated domain
MDWVLERISTYGYGGIFFLLVLGIVGLPVPDETLLVFTGYLVSRGRLNPAGAFLSALAGSWCGISLSYTLGRTLGLGVVHRFGKYLHITEERLAKVHRWFDRTGHWALVIGYFIAGVRHFTAIVAGTSKMSFPSFVAYAWSGGLLWVSSFITLGYFLGENWRQITDSIEQYLLYVSIALIAGAACYYLLNRRSKRGDSPRKPVA